jgi:hypothetical protein
MARRRVAAAFGLFYDHPLLAIAFNSDIADAVQAATRHPDSGQPGANSAVECGARCFRERFVLRVDQ